MSEPTVLDDAKDGARTAVKMFGIGVLIAVAVLALALTWFGLSASTTARNATNINALPNQVYAAGVIDNFTCIYRGCGSSDDAKAFLTQATATGYTYTPATRDAPGSLQADGNRHVATLSTLTDSQWRAVAAAATREGQVTTDTVTDTTFTTPAGVTGTITLTTTPTTLTLTSILYTES